MKKTKSVLLVLSIIALFLLGISVPSDFSVVYAAGEEMASTTDSEYVSEEILIDSEENPLYEATDELVYDIFRYKVYSNFNEKIVEIVGLVSGTTETIIEIPEEIEGKRVTILGDSAFYQCKQITDITIPTGVTTIGNNAFSGCSDLKSITIPSGITKIGSGTFSGCTSLTKVTIPDSVISIEAYAFYNCKSLSHITIPKGVESMGRYYDYENKRYIFLPELVFKGCSGLESIVVDKDNQKYDSRADCDAIIETDSNTLIAGCYNTIIPESVESIGDYAFYQCDRLTEIIIPNTVTCIGNHSFDSCNSLEDITVSKNIVSIGDYAFYKCSSINKIILPDSVASIGDYAFYECSSINTIILPDSITSIGDYAFDRCSSLIEVTLPKSITSISNHIFDRCSSLKKITLPDGVTRIGDQAFYRCSNLTEINIPDGVTSIGAWAFGHCVNLEEVLLPSSITSIGEYAFVRCNKLVNLFVPDSVISLDKNVFRGCCVLVIKCNRGSNVEQYAKDNNLLYVTPEYTGFINLHGKCLYYKNGENDTNYTGPACGTIKGTKAWYYVKKGIYDSTYKGFQKVGNSWMYFFNGYVDKTLNSDYYGAFYGTVNGKDAWYVVNKGKAYPEYNGYALVGNSWMYYKNGIIDKSITDVTQYVSINGVKQWWYIKNGKAMINYCGFAKVGSTYWYFERGKINKSANFIANGKVNGIKDNYYVKNGKVNLNFTGSVNINGITYKIKNGKVKSSNYAHTHHWEWETHIEKVHHTEKYLISDAWDQDIYESTVIGFHCRTLYENNDDFLANDTCCGGWGTGPWGFDYHEYYDAEYGTNEWYTYEELKDYQYCYYCGIRK